MKLLNVLNYIASTAEYEVAFDHGSYLSTEWLQRVTLWQQTLNANKDLHRIALFIADSAELSALLVAIWLCEKEAWLAPNNLPLTTQQLATRVDGFIGDFPQVETVVPDRIIVAATPRNPSHFENSVLADTAALVLFTSGSSGEPQLIKKALRQLAAEVQQLERCFGAAIGRSRIYATVSHQHIYGLLFRVLWPLAYGRAFCRYTAEFIEPIYSGESAPVCLVSSPTHLTRLPAKLANRASTRMVFSSGGPLPSGASHKAHNLLGADVVEVFGSTETGGIGWRRQHKQESGWTLFDVVQAKVNERQHLVIRSPFLCDDTWFETSDIVSMNDGAFTLNGRADRVVKVEGKRVSLEQIEACLMAHEWIDDVRVEQVLRAGEIARREELMALVVLSEMGAMALQQDGRRILAAHFKSTLGQLLERPLVPRRWRYLEKLPRNAQGKIQRLELQALMTEIVEPMERSQ